MKTNMQRNLMCTFAGMLSLTVAATLSTPANAQAKMKKQKSAPMQKDSMMKSDKMQGNMMMDKNASAEERRMMTLGEKFGDYKYVDPAPLNYPMAAPDSLNIYHFDSYTGDRIMAGSIEDHRMDKMMMADKTAMKMDKMNRPMTRGAYYDDPFTADPAPVNYPLAAPGSLDLYHFSDYTMNKIGTGSATDKKMDKMMMQDKMMMKGNMMSGGRSFTRQAYYDNPFMADPAPVNYPLAAPGTLDLYHFRTYMENELMTGSASDAKMDKQMMRDNMTPGSKKMDKGAMKSGKMKK